MAVNFLQQLSIWAIPVLFAITVHEVAHGWVARLHGDATAQMLGRLTLNPIRHIDPFGTLLVPAVLLMAGGLLFGWAKPVPITWENLRRPQRDMVLVAAAGPLANLLMAVLWAAVMRAGIEISAANPWVGHPMELMGQAGIIINLVLMVLNLLPVPPLDGGRVVSGFLPRRLAVQYGRVEPYGLLIIVLVLFSGSVTPVNLATVLIGKPVYSLYGLLGSVFGLPQL